MVRRDAIWKELSLRFDTAFRHAIVASGYAFEVNDVEDIITHCILELHNAVQADTRGLCLPELMWQACQASMTIPQERRAEIRVRFHLRALLDELPPSDARTALRLLTFSRLEERIARKHDGVQVRNDFGPEREHLVKQGLGLFGQYLHENRTKVEGLTGGVIRASALESLDGALWLITDNLGVHES